MKSIGISFNHQFKGGSFENPISDVRSRVVSFFLFFDRDSILDTHPDVAGAGYTPFLYSWCRGIRFTERRMYEEDHTITFGNKSVEDRERKDRRGRGKYEERRSGSLCEGMGICGAYYHFRRRIRPNSDHNSGKQQRIPSSRRKMHTSWRFSLGFSCLFLFPRRIVDRQFFY